MRRVLESFHAAGRASRSAGSGAVLLSLALVTGPAAASGRPSGVQGRGARVRSAAPAPRESFSRDATSVPVGYRGDDPADVFARVAAAEGQKSEFESEADYRRARGARLSAAFARPVAFVSDPAPRNGGAYDAELGAFVLLLPGETYAPDGPHMSSYFLAYRSDSRHLGSYVASTVLGVRFRVERTNTESWSIERSGSRVDEQRVLVASAAPAVAADLRPNLRALYICRVPLSPADRLTSTTSGRYDTSLSNPADGSVVSHKLVLELVEVRLFDARTGAVLARVALDEKEDLTAASRQVRSLESRAEYDLGPQIAAATTPEAMAPLRARLHMLELGTGLAYPGGTHVAASRDRVEVTIPFVRLSEWCERRGVGTETLDCGGDYTVANMFDSGSESTALVVAGLGDLGPRTVLRISVDKDADERLARMIAGSAAGRLVAALVYRLAPDLPDDRLVTMSQAGYRGLVSQVRVELVAVWILDKATGIVVAKQALAKDGLRFEPGR